MPDEKEPGLPEEFADKFAGRLDWRERLEKSRDTGLGYAAPGGQFTRALHEACLARRAGNFPGSMKGQSVVELGAGMMPHGYLMAATFEAKNYLAIEPYYADVLLKTIRQVIAGVPLRINTIAKTPAEAALVPDPTSPGHLC